MEVTYMDDAALDRAVDSFRTSLDNAITQYEQSVLRLRDAMIDRLIADLIERGHTAAQATLMIQRICTEAVISPAI